MKKLIMLSIIAASLPLNLLAQDDLYFVPTKELAEQTAREYGMPRETYYIGSRRSVDDYNRRGSAYQVIDSLGNDVIYMDSIAGVYPDSSYVDPDDYRYTERMSRFDGYSPSADFWAGYDAGRSVSWLSPWYYDSWYSPYRYSLYGYYGYYGSWYDPWYDPWYYGYYGYYPYSYRWYSWYGPYYYGYYGGYYGGYYDRYHGGHHTYSRTPVVRHGVEYYGATRQTPRGSFGNTGTRRNTTTSTSTSRGTFGASRRTDTTPRTNTNNTYTPPRNNSYTPPSNNSGSFGGSRGGNSGGGGSFGGSRGGSGGGGGGGFGRHR